MSIHPKYCSLIASGKKTIEIRKTIPKLKTPFKVYVYCTKEKTKKESLILGPFGSLQTGGIENDLTYKLNGSIIGEFTCDKIYKIDKDSVDFFYKTDIETIYFEEAKKKLNLDTCVSPEELSEYMNHRQVNGLHVTQFILYEKPIDIGNFKYFKCVSSRSCSTCKITDCVKFVEKPPQSWMYVVGIEKPLEIWNGQDSCPSCHRLLGPQGGFDYIIRCKFCGQKIMKG